MSEDPVAKHPGTMDVILHYADEYVLDDYVYPASLPRDDIFRQYGTTFEPWLLRPLPCVRCVRRTVVTVVVVAVLSLR